jgi:hypothetical protein
METGISTEQIAWALEHRAGLLHAARLTNRLTGTVFDLAPRGELSLVLSASADRLVEPRRPVSDFELREVLEQSPGAVKLRLESPSTGIVAHVSYAVEGPIRRKRARVTNTTGAAILVLDVVLDDVALPADVRSGGQGQPVFAGGELFAAVEHPAGMNQVAQGRVRLSHFPGKALAPGASLDSSDSVVAVTPEGEPLASFVAWIRARSVRLAKRTRSVYSPFGINNQWGPCPTLDDRETLDVLSVLEGWRARGVHFDYFALDGGWVDPGTDLTRFRPVAYPEGPGEMTRRVRSAGMELGLWFATSWAGMSCWDYQPAWGNQPVPGITFRNGHPSIADYRGSFCLAAPPYYDIVKNAVLHHMRENGARLLKIDGGSYVCDDVSHGHLPGPYATERMYNLLIELAAAARAQDPDVFIMWYWGLRSPFWALHGDTIFESGLFMEGSGTSSFPTLCYRDSVTLAQDQNACHATTIPPLVKDSLGVWLADIRWGNYMGKERWREAMVMDLGRGNLLFPTLWGDVYLLDDSDVRFLARIQRLAKRSERLLLGDRSVVGDAMRGEPYGYLYGDGTRALAFLNNPRFTAERLRVPLGARLRLGEGRGGWAASLFPDRVALVSESGTPPLDGDALDLWLRPFETTIVEIRPRPGRETLPLRSVAESAVHDLGLSLPLRNAAASPALEAVFADAARLEAQGHRQSAQYLTGRLPALVDGPPPVLAVAVRLRRDGEEWKYAPYAAEIVQVVARVSGERLSLAPVPDARQFGNTQKAGCSWVVYKTRLARRWSSAPLEVAAHLFAPKAIHAEVEAWVVRQWWTEASRPSADGYYAEAPS